MFKFINNIVKTLFVRKKKLRDEVGNYGTMPGVLFNEVTETNTTLTNNEVQEGAFIKVVFDNKPMWALFKCPCGCKETISLSLQKVHRNHWSVKKSRNNRPSLYPSVRQKGGCYSHFWIEDGRVYWCHSFKDFN